MIKSRYRETSGVARQRDELSSLMLLRVSSFSLSYVTYKKDHSPSQLAFSFLRGEPLGARARVNLYTLVRSRFLITSVSFQTTPGFAPAVHYAAAHHLGRTSNDRSYAHCKRAQGTGDALHMARRWPCGALGRKQFRGTKTTLSQAWSGNCIRGPQCAFEMSMFMCPAVHKLTRN